MRCDYPIMKRSCSLPSTPLKLILIVDDSLDICDLLATFIRQTEAFDVEIAQSTKEAQALFVPGKFFAVLLDLNLGESIEDGMELANEFRRQDDSVYIAIISGYQPPFDDRLLESINDVLTKPIDFAVLRAKLMRWSIEVHQKELTRQYFDDRFVRYESRLKRICEEQREIDAQLSEIEVFLSGHAMGGANG